ncbi:MAG: dTDP-4-dehydrorhamnose 3,5-epimerase [Chloroflexota bacterium]|nr:dTDP-4-dehydrorhamnose 3,5-epimerase [Dehalococcoidia bacterium]MDW8253772.1 dTDP-4-dehydrorhamnose 3,5-epimerase [Chloroflexota bacterium]
MRTTVIPTSLDGVVIIEVDYFRDDRGFFIETYRRSLFAELGLPTDFVQDNHSRSRRGVLRGIHYQDMRAPMGKLVRCTRGAIWDVIVDLRFGAPTFGRWTAVQLDDETLRQVYIPVGFGHGFAVLSEVADVEYRCTGYYAPEAEGTIAWNDPELAIPWPIAQPILSARDQRGITLAEYRRQPAFSYHD